MACLLICSTLDILCIKVKCIETVTEEDVKENVQKTMETKQEELKKLIQMASRGLLSNEEFKESRGIKNLDALYFKTTNQPETKIQNEVDLEGRDSPAFFGEDDMPQVATEKQLNFAKKLIANCDDDKKEQYLEQISSPYFSKFQCSELIQKLMPVR
jgi:hypothetical protein